MGRITEFLDNITTEQLMERLELALDGAGLGIWDWDPRDNSVQFDRRWCEMLGLDHDKTSMQLTTWESRVHPDDLAQCYRDIQAHVEGRTAQYENVHRMRHADGRWVYILDRGRICEREPDGKPARFTGTHFDVTVVETARQVLASQGRQLATMVRKLPLPAAMVNRERRLLAVSERWLSDRGLSEEAVIGLRLDEIPECIDQCLSSTFKRELEGDMSSEHEGSFARANGDAAWLRWHISPWHGVEGEIAGIIYVLEDITTERQQRAAQEHESRLSALGLMAGAVGHEINTPLQVVLLEAEQMVCSLERRSASEEELRRAAETIRATTAKIANIVASMRKLSRDPRHDPVESVDVEELLQSVEALCAGRMAGRRVAFEVRSGPRDIKALGRAAELGQVLLNLLNNSLDALEDHPEKWIRLEASIEGASVIFRCIDSGSGVPERMQTQIMQPFFTTKPVGKGTGLGLSISHALAVRLGGFLRHEPTASHTTFAFGVPRAEDEGVERG